MTPEQIMAPTYMETVTQHAPDFIVVTDLGTGFCRILRAEDILDVGVGMSQPDCACHVRVKVKHTMESGLPKYVSVRETVEEIARKLNAK